MSRAGIRLRRRATAPLLVCLGAALGWLCFWTYQNWPLVGAKLRGDAPHCPWSKILSARQEGALWGRVWRDATSSVSVVRREPALGIELLKSSEGEFWIQSGDTQAWNGTRLLGYLLAEQVHMATTNPADMVRAGDVVFDCGAHVGVFTHFALKRGAAKVIAVEPEPANLECFRRNYEHEIRAGRVVLVPKAVWDSETTLPLHESNVNSGANSVVGESNDRRVEIQATTIDILVAELRLPRVDFIKLDIEGAEREALRGARRSLQQFRPRLMLDAYHLPDDPVALPDVIRKSYPGYRAVCGPCELAGPQFIPHAIFFHP